MLERIIIHTSGEAFARTDKLEVPESILSRSQQIEFRTRMLDWGGLAQEHWVGTKWVGMKVKKKIKN